MNVYARHQWGSAFREFCATHDFSWDEFSLTRPGGLSRGVLIHKPGQHQSDIILFLHGFGNDCLFPSVDFFKSLLRSGYGIATVDLDGHGLAGTSIFDPENLFTLSRSLVDFVESKFPGRDRLHLIGYSLGAAIQLSFAVQAPERVNSLSLIGMPFHILPSPKLAKEGLAVVNSNFLSAVRTYGPVGVLPAFGGFKRQTFPLRLPIGLKKVDLKILNSIFKSLNVSEILPLVAFPTLFVAGAQDPTVDIDYAQSCKKSSDFIQVQSLAGETHLSSMLSPKCWKRIEIFLRSAHQI